MPQTKTVQINTRHPPTGLYVHIPWCVRKCPYCDFNSHERRHEIDERAYVRKLIEDYRSDQESIDRSISTVYIGGGTPSLFHADSYELLFKELNLTGVPEITLEANPGTIERDDFDKYARAGVTRVSIGVQSFDAEKLESLGRIPSSDEAAGAVQQALRSGLDSVNLDLMYGLPNQTVDQVLEDLRIAIELNPAHISWYQLTIEPNTVFGRHPPQLPIDDYRAEMSERGIELLQANGFERYEVSAYARDDKKCEHNLNYWQFGDYLGIGAGAHGKLTKSDRLIRTRKNKQPDAYLESTKRITTEIDKRELPVEFMMNSLRLTKGVTKSQFTDRTRLPYACIETTVSALVEEKVMQPDRLALTEFGYRHLDYAVGQFLH